MISVKNATFAYSEHEIIKNCNFDVSSGKIIVLRGANGSGKSTLLKALRGLIRPSKGEIYYTRNCKISYLTQVNTLNPLMPISARACVELSLTQIELKKYQVKINEAFIGMKLSLLEHTYLKHLSRGQLQKILFLRALFNKADLYLFDEPFNHMDSDSILYACELIKYFKIKGSSFILSTHIDEVPEEIIDKVFDLDKHHCALC